MFRQLKKQRGLVFLVWVLEAAAILYFIEFITREARHGHLRQANAASNATASTTTAANTTRASFIDYSSSMEGDITECTTTVPCRRPGLRILYFVHTGPRNVKKRAWLRKTIGDPQIETLVNSAIVFFVGVASDPKERRLVEEEAAQEGDVVVLNFTDTYRNLTLKFIHGAKWVEENCFLNSTTTIVKIDDDVLVNVFALSSYVDSSVMRQNRIHCFLFTQAHPFRMSKSKWYVSREEYAPDRYPTYCAGAAFMMQPAVLTTLYEASTHVPFFWVDDVYVTGILASLTGVDMVDIRRYFGLWVDKGMRNVSKTMLFVHTGRPNRIRNKIDELWRSVLRVNQTLSDHFMWKVNVRHRKMLPWLVDWVVNRTGNDNISLSITQ